MTSSSNRTLRILVVEDEPVIQMLLEDHLLEMGLGAELAGSAAEARSIMQRLDGQFDGAIVDVGLPDARGDELVRELRAAYPGLPVVISSGYDRAALQGRFAGERSVECITKPFTGEQLRRALRNVGAADQHADVAG